jgi:GntR family transcriptional repressor for pyruvate dehydrogenase complex
VTVPNSEPTARDRVFAALVEAVLGGRYAAGERLPAQRALAADLGVTMGPLREALERLQQMGLVEVRHGEPMRVRDWRRAGGLDVLAHLLLRSGGVDPGLLGDVLEARALMLGEIAALAAARRDDAHVASLRDLAAALAGEADAGHAAALDFAWVTQLAEAAANVVFLLILNAIRDVYLAHPGALPVAADPAAMAPAYAAVVDAVAAGDSGRAREAALALAAGQRRYVERALAGGDR